jgi:hypothetical protein
MTHACTDYSRITAMPLSILAVHFCPLLPPAPTLLPSTPAPLTARQTRVQGVYSWWVPEGCP